MSNEWTKGPVLLVGIDFENVTRECWHEDFETALQIARTLMQPDKNGPAWTYWEIWGNDTSTSEWAPVMTSRTPAEDL